MSPLENLTETLEYLQRRHIKKGLSKAAIFPIGITNRGAFKKSQLFYVIAKTSMSSILKTIHTVSM